MDTQVKGINSMFTPTTDQLIGDLKKVVEDSQCLPADVGTYSENKLAVTRPAVEAKLRFAKEKLEDARDALTDRTKAFADSTHQYAVDNPWKTLGIAAAGLAALGYLFMRRD